jgi:hypothetical protein
VIVLPPAMPLVTLPAGAHLWRIHRKDLDPLWFGPGPGHPPRSRFDAPAGEYRVCYLGDSPEVALAETIVRQPTARLVPRARLDQRQIARVPVMRDLRLARLHGPGLALLNIGAEVVHGHPYSVCQFLALDIWNHPDHPDGIAYRSRCDNDHVCVALFDRAADALAAPDEARDLGDARVSIPLLRRYGVGLS